jgi:hypothetical protein
MQRTKINKVREKKIQNIAEEFQKECHSFTKAVIEASDKPISNQDVTNVWIYRKLAELKVDLDMYNYGKMELM